MIVCIKSQPNEAVAHKLTIKIKTRRLAIFESLFATFIFILACDTTTFDSVKKVQRFDNVSRTFGCQFFDDTSAR